MAALTPESWTWAVEISPGIYCRKLAAGWQREVVASKSRGGPTSGGKYGPPFFCSMPVSRCQRHQRKSALAPALALEDHRGCTWTVS